MRHHWHACASHARTWRASDIDDALRSVMGSLDGVVAHAVTWLEYLPDALQGFVDLVVPDADEAPRTAAGGFEKDDR